MIFHASEQKNERFSRERAKRTGALIEISLPKRERVVSMMNEQTRGGSTFGPSSKIWSEDRT